MAWPQCLIDLHVRDGRAFFDAVDVRATRFRFQCPRCHERLVHYANEGDAFACASCRLGLHVEGGAVCYDTAALGDGVTPALHQAVDLDAAMRRDQDADDVASVDHAAIRRALAGAPAAIAKLHGERAGQAELVRQALSDWWDEKADFPFGTAQALAAALLSLQQPRAHATGRGRQDVFAQCLEQVRPDLARWASARSE
jgi:hypothetical protein